MVARGDMGLQMDLESVPQAQKSIIAACSRAGVPVITATQMLESMVENPRPTRAEVSDVYNSVLDGTDAVMLSGETAAGRYPVECVRAMSRIVEQGEGSYDRLPVQARAKTLARAPEPIPPTEAVALAVAAIERQIRAKAILTTSSSGQTPRLVSKVRPHAPVLCATWNPGTLAFMSLVWGVEAALIPPPDYGDETYAHAVEAFQHARRLKTGDTIVFTAGVPAGTPGNTNLIMIQTVR